MSYKWRQRWPFALIGVQDSGWLVWHRTKIQSISYSLINLPSRYVGFLKNIKFCGIYTNLKKSIQIFTKKSFIKLVPKKKLTILLKNGYVPRRQIYQRIWDALDFCSMSYQSAGILHTERSSLAPSIGHSLKYFLITKIYFITRNYNKINPRTRFLIILFLKCEKNYWKRGKISYAEVLYPLKRILKPSYFTDRNLTYKVTIFI